ncbi:hypothetical protein HPB48_007563 [Haemaphysalis longicornis]|uniref:Peptidase M13 C-terminal domain-containing protein n=1 Tax=Haemaphysalis longicornis TaxID=44386 RepID=A0A9J6FDA2_HAELO|nr:hypothetical protein HPB48_007563 [Haemaphysalis longicornis]
MTSGSSFFQFWLLSAMAKRNLMTKARDLSKAEALLASAGTPPQNYVLPYFAYDNLQNSVAVSVAAISMPYFHGPGTKAMRHGGLGFPYALELVRAFDPSGQGKVDVRDVPVNESVLAAWKEEIAKKAAESALCSTKVRGDRKAGALAGTTHPFPEVPAIEIAYRAFESSLDQERVPESDVVKQKQVFFIASCLVMCSLPGSFNRHRLDCNKAVANFPPFRDAFNCPSGVWLNYTNKCGFFD